MNALAWFEFGLNYMFTFGSFWWFFFLAIMIGLVVFWIMYRRRQV